MKEESLTLLERAKTYIKSAEMLHYQEDYDSAASRSYYAMYFTVEALLIESNLDFSSHKSVISLFGKHFVKTGLFKPSLGRNLRRAFERRLIGDYSFASQITKEESLEALGWAQDFNEIVSKHLKSCGGTVKQGKDKK